MGVVDGKVQAAEPPAVPQVDHSAAVVVVLASEEVFGDVGMALLHRTVEWQAASVVASVNIHAEIEKFLRKKKHNMCREKGRVGVGIGKLVSTSIQ